MEAPTKQCRVWGIDQPLEELYRVDGCVDGRRHTGRTCFQAKATARADADPALRHCARERTAAVAPAACGAAPATRRWASSATPPQLVRRAEAYLRSHHRPAGTDRRISRRLGSLAGEAALA